MLCYAMLRQVIVTMAIAGMRAEILADYDVEWCARTQN